MERNAARSSAWQALHLTLTNCGTATYDRNGIEVTIVAGIIVLIIGWIFKKKNKEKSIN